MRRSQIIKIVVVLVIVFAGIWAARQNHWLPMFSNTRSPAHSGTYFCPMHPSYVSDRPGQCLICHMSLVQMKSSEEANASHDHAALKDGSPKELTLKELMSMKPGQICLLHKCKMGNCIIAMTEEMARLGKCPHCKEDLGVIIKDLLPEGYAHVKLSPDKQRTIGIQTVTAETIDLKKTIRTVGVIAQDSELYQAEAEYIQALKAYERAQTGNLQEVIEQAKALVESTEVRLTYLGLNDELINEVAKMSTPDQSLLFTKPGGSVWVYAKIYEYEIPLVTVGQVVGIEVSSLPDKPYVGTIRSIDSILDSVTRMVRVRAQIENTDGFLKSDMYVNFIIEVDLGNVLAVPKEAVFDTGTRKIIFVDKKDGNFEPREVILGASTETYYEIKSGIQAGDQIVISGNFLIDSESRLKSALSQATGGHQHGG